MWSEGNNTDVVFWLHPGHVQRGGWEMAQKWNGSSVWPRGGALRETMDGLDFPLFIQNTEFGTIGNGESSVWVSKRLQFAKSLQCASLLKHLTDKICQQLAWSHVTVLDAGNHQGQTQDHQAINWGKVKDLSVKEWDSRNGHFISKQFY